MFTAECLEKLRQKIDLIDVLGSHIDLKRSGAAYKALCPFHDEKTPSFMVQRGDTHYHCFGCGAHGDAIQFLMSYAQYPFTAAVEHLAEKFLVPLERVDRLSDSDVTHKGRLKEALQLAHQFYHFYLLYSEEGREAIHYLAKRKLPLSFIKQFQIGWAPKKGQILRRLLHQKGFSDPILEEGGLLTQNRNGGFKDFFTERLLFPISDAQGTVIGFSGRKIYEKTFGGKYVNTPETPLFKKSKTLFGLNFCRRRIAKQQQVLIVEGQIDALRLIFEGLNFVVAAQGTAFGEGHVRELTLLGVARVFLAFDGDSAGHEAAIKVGNLFQKIGIEVLIVPIPQGMDPDSLVKAKGIEGMLELLKKPIDYLTFLVRRVEGMYEDPKSPAAKNHIALQIAKIIHGWDHPLMVQESLKKAAGLLHIQEGMMGLAHESIPNTYIKYSSSLDALMVDSDKVLESEVLRWLILAGQSEPNIWTLVRQNLKEEDFSHPHCRRIFILCLKLNGEKKPADLLSLAAWMDEEDHLFMKELLSKKVPLEKALSLLTASIQEILNRNWIRNRETLKEKMRTASEEEQFALAKEFDLLKHNVPKVLT